MPQGDLYLFDVDGTIAPTCGMVSDAVADALLALHARVPVLLSTGRSLGGLDPILARCPLPGPHAVSNGMALVTNRTISHSFNALTPEQVNIITAYLEGRGMYAVYALADGNLQATHYHEAMDEIVEEGAWPPIYGPLDGQVPVHKILTICFPEEEADIRTICAGETEVIRTQFNMIEWTAPGGNKGNALGHQIAALGLNAPKVVAIGDSENDLALFAKADHKVAMGHASRDVLAAADEVINGPLDRWILRQLRV